MPVPVPVPLSLTSYQLSHLEVPVLSCPVLCSAGALVGWSNAVVTGTMLDIEPKSLVFRDIRLNESYTSNLLLTNPLSTHVSVTLRPSAPGRYVIAPNQINIQPGKSVVVTVRLHINNFPAYEKGVRGQEDHIQVSSSFFEQKISSMIFLQKRSGSSSLLASTAASFQNRSVIGQDSSSVVGPSSTSAIQQPPPPPEEDSHKHRKFIKTMKNNASFAAAANAEKRSTEHIIAELNSAVKLRDMTIEKLNATIVKLEQNHPNFHDIIRDRVELERISFEEKSQKVRGGSWWWCPLLFLKFSGKYLNASFIGS